MWASQAVLRQRQQLRASHCSFDAKVESHCKSTTWRIAAGARHEMSRTLVANGGFATRSASSIHKPAVEGALRDIYTKLKAAVTPE
jgi:hypothetical protein